MPKSGPISAPDPYVPLFALGAAFGADPLDNKYVNNRTLSSQTLNAGIRNCVLLIAGQSNMANAHTTNYVPTNTGKVDNFNFFDGAIYTATDPLLGCSSGFTAGIPFGGNVGGRIADKLINANKFDRVILAPVAVDGSVVGQWQSNYYARIQLAIMRLALKGMVPTGILWGQGESDSGGTTQVAYTASLNSVITASRTAGYAGPWFISVESMVASVTDANIQNAQTGIVNHGLNIWAGPNADTAVIAANRGDGTHFTDTGCDLYATAAVAAFAAFGAPF